ncbi:PHD-finger family protein [Trichomonas vaginalis G3]|uniref:PHD-finger family protein n=1 Tax=Trichomonas vaginalis (strain ATCC PRA-98 / G3) TaxID=412133 RepID=A2E8E8_TRIV3|nr:FYVE/PHD zinc finger family [Trichomonas vaginalis G3]EAY11076.1 PHD-finger family protein [Trichomonas vaginalis G3]KAI5520487.1 FYVE/PHD zinc finger family [Trichomonas vaginalis G3]|eukprot:XP_001323299.1 PHD-finger family protein [Trichomonas vaginalis G3]
MQGECFSFLNAIASEMKTNNHELETTGKSLTELINESCEYSNEIRCICGFHVDSNNLIQCSVCKKYLHKKCIPISDDFEIDNFICPFCMYQKYDLDPLASIDNAFELFNKNIKEIQSLLKQLEPLHKKAKAMIEDSNASNTTSSQRASYDEMQKSIFSSINSINQQIKDRTNLLHQMEKVMFSPPS